MKKKMINNKIHPWTLTGIIDAKGSLGVNIEKDVTRKADYVLTVFLEIGLNTNDKTLLERIKATLEVGNIYYKASDSTYRWKVSNINQISDVILPHLTNYPLLTQKRADFELFARIIKILKRKQHLRLSGFQETINLIASFNHGLSDNLKVYFPNIVNVPRPEVKFKGIIDPNWLAGFTESEACFSANIYRSLRLKLGYSVRLLFKITQHFGEVELLKGIEKYFSCGKVKKRSIDICDFSVNSFKDLDEKIIPFFLKYPFQGSKLEGFKDFHNVVKIIKAERSLIKKMSKTNKGKK